MLSKKEIKHILDANVDIITYKADKDFRCLTSTEKALLENNEKVKEYIDQLESREQKLIEKLEERIKAVDECYNELLTDVGGIKIINITGLSKKEKEEIINKRNCLLVQKHCYQEILEILKKE